MTRTGSGGSAARTFRPLPSVSRQFCSPAIRPPVTDHRCCSRRRQVVRPRFGGRPTPSVRRRRWTVGWSASIRTSTSDLCPPSPGRGSSATKETRKSGFRLNLKIFSFSRSEKKKRRSAYLNISAALEPPTLFRCDRFRLLPVFMFVSF